MLPWAVLLQGVPRFAATAWSGRRWLGAVPAAGARAARQSLLLKGTIAASMAAGKRHRS